MQYLGKLSGTGILTCENREIARATFDFDRFQSKPGHVTTGGEIRSAPNALKQVFGRKNVRLKSDSGNVFQLRFSDKKLDAASKVAHVDVVSGSPPVST